MHENTSQLSIYGLYVSHLKLNVLNVFDSEYQKDHDTESTPKYSYMHSNKRTRTWQSTPKYSSMHTCIWITTLYIENFGHKYGKKSFIEKPFQLPSYVKIYNANGYTWYIYVTSLSEAYHTCQSKLDHLPKT